MKLMLDNLLRLQSLECGKQRAPAGSPGPEELRKRIPAPILQQYDRLRARGKKGIALVRHGVCSQCHMQVAVGLLAQLRRPDNVHRCQNCGAYLQIADEPSEIAPLEIRPRNVRPARRGRPPKATVHVA